MLIIVVNFWSLVSVKCLLNLVIVQKVSVKNIGKLLLVKYSGEILYANTYMPVFLFVSVVIIISAKLYSLVKMLNLCSKI